ncbi:MAG: amidohydrolase family protein [Gammaproteobacteria bacterium]
MEKIIEADLPVCDPHHHLWDYPDSMYMLDEFMQDVANGHRVRKTVYVECQRHYRSTGPKALQPVGETEFIEQLLARQQGDIEVAAGIVGFADLTLGPAVQEVLEAHIQASPRFRGIRYMSAWDASEQIRNAQTGPTQNLLQRKDFRDGFACLAGLGLAFDAWVYHPQLAELLKLAQAFPETTIIVNHSGGPLGIGPYADKRDEVFEIWQKGMRQLATSDNVVVKLGGLTMSMCGFGWNKREIKPDSAELAEAMRPYYQTCIEYFGPQRCMFESNFPVDRVSCSYNVLWNAFKRLACGYSATECSALLHDTAARSYRLD